WLKQFILGIRKIRGEMNISPGKPLPCFIKSYSKKDQSYIENNKAMLFALAKLDTVDLLSVDDEEPESAIALVGKMKILIPLAGLIDKGAERERLNKEIEKLVKLKSQFSAKLNNEKFINGAPKAVVKNEKEKLASAESALKDLEQQLEKISKL
ncbi:MAG: valine--tRNA ligase, partial [Thiotrichales bacterium]|nr:valine--tRNA ligase [Thiotrichales bacterium]